MGRLIRFVIMFGPMIYKGVNKLLASRKKGNDTPVSPTEENNHEEEE